MSTFWGQNPAIERDLETVKEIMRQNVKCSDKIIETALLDLINSGGKLLRPAFVLLAGQFGEKYDQKKLYNLAAVIEMLHMSTLVHDDIIDDAVMRRGKETIQSNYGKNYAVFMGDFLFCRCFMLLSNNTSMENMKMVSRVISRICIGEIGQFSSQFNRHVTIRQYLKRIAAKTAALFALSLYTGASESGCGKKLSTNLGRIGYNIGMAFQIIDDILDYSGEEKIVGKPLGNDLKQGVFTLPLIYALKVDKGELSQLLSKRPYSDDDIKKMIEIITRLGGIGRARVLAKKYTDKAFELISKLPGNESKQILFDITEKLLLREY